MSETATSASESVRETVLGAATRASDEASSRAMAMASSLYTGRVGEGGAYDIGAMTAQQQQQQQQRRRQSDFAQAEKAAAEDMGGTLIYPPAETRRNPAPLPPSALRRRPYLELGWVLRNPYSSVMGNRRATPTGTSAVRALLHIVPEAHQQRVRFLNDGTAEDDGGGRGLGATMPELQVGPSNSFGSRGSLESPSDEQRSGGGGGATTASDLDSEGRTGGDDGRRIRTPNASSSALSESMMSAGSASDFGLGGGGGGGITDAETASRLAAGTIRALRDLALDEAAELHASLRFWTVRWESPALSWLEAGPTAWFSERGYCHQDVGGRVSQIQAVLARRCASVGELQMHLLRAGWQRGVAQWGVVGQGQVSALTSKCPRRRQIWLLPKHRARSLLQWHCNLASPLFLSPLTSFSGLRLPAAMA